MTFEAALDFLDRCGTEEDVPGLVRAFLQTAAAFGLEHGAGGAWTGMGRKRSYRFYFNTWPADWVTLYSERQVFHDDPIIMEAQRRMTPFLWRDLQKHRSLGDQSARIMEQVFAYGWVDGLVVPVHGPAGYQGVVSLATKRELVLRPADMSLLWVMAMAVHERCRATLGMGTETPPPALTARETECMRWIAAGKTEWETAQVVGISAATVHFHVEQVKRRLATGSRTEAVALLVLHGAL